MLLAAVQLGHLVQLVDAACAVRALFAAVGAALAADAHAHEALGLQLLEEFQMLALAVLHDGRQDHQPGVLGQGHDGVHHLRDGLGLQALVRVVRTVGGAGAGEQQPQVVVDLGDGAHRRARVVAGGLLLDGDGGRQALDQVDIRLFHQLQELPGVGRERLHVPALPFGVQGVEGQGRLARARQPGDHHQLIARDVERDVLQVVGACAAYADHRSVDVRMGVRGRLRAGSLGGHAVGMGVLRIP